MQAGTNVVPVHHLDMSCRRLPADLNWLHIQSNKEYVINR